MKVKMAFFSLIAMLCYATFGFASDSSSLTGGDILSFHLWKERQIVEAKNQVVRLSNRIHLLKTGRYKLEAGALDLKEPLLGEQGEQEYESLKNKEKNIDEETLKKAEEKVLKTAQDRMKTALENLQYAKELNIDDYLAVYLSQYKEDDESLKKLIKKLSDQELLELVKSQIANGPNSPGAKAPSTSPILSEFQTAPRPSATQGAKSL